MFALHPANIYPKIRTFCLCEQTLKNGIVESRMTGKRRMETNPLDSFQLCRLYEQTLGKGGF